MNAMYMSLLNCSSCFTRELVAIGRCISMSSVSAGWALERGGLNDGRFAYFSSEILGCDSIKRTDGEKGPDFGVRWLNCESVE